MPEQKHLAHDDDDRQSLPRGDPAGGDTRPIHIPLTSDLAQLSQGSPGQPRRGHETQHKIVKKASRISSHHYGWPAREAPTGPAPRRTASPRSTWPPPGDRSPGGRPVPPRATRSPPDPCGRTAPRREPCRHTSEHDVRGWEAGGGSPHGRDRERSPAHRGRYGCRPGTPRRSRASGASLATWPQEDGPPPAPLPRSDQVTAPSDRSGHTSRRRCTAERHRPEASAAREQRRPPPDRARYA